MISKIFYIQLPTRANAFIIQKKLFQTLLSSHKDSPLYKNIWLKQDQTSDLLDWDETRLKEYIAQFMLIEYTDHILPLYNDHRGIVSDKYDLLIKTSGTCDANQWGKLIPANWSSLNNDRVGMQRTISYYLSTYLSSNLFFTSAFTLTAPFDSTKKTWYISGAMRYTNNIYQYLFFPPDDILAIDNRQVKKDKIIQQLLQKNISIWSFHGVPTRWLDIIDDLIERDIIKAKEILKKCEYVSIGWWPALDYKQQFQQRIWSLWLDNRLSASNNHNASEWFLASQTQNFDDLEYHWMSPVMQTNFFLFVEMWDFERYKRWDINYRDMVIKSYLLHEVAPEREYLLLFANHRIPRFYNIKDKVMFKDNFTSNNDIWSDPLLEYIVTGRYGMASNIFNEHIELPHLVDVFDMLWSQWYVVDQYNFVAGMQLVDNEWIFHIIIEASLSYDVSVLTSLIDMYLWQVNDQRKIFRERNKIAKIELCLVKKGQVRQGLIAIGKMHQQSKIPYLSDSNYKEIIEPLLLQIKK